MHNNHCHRVTAQFQLINIIIIIIITTTLRTYEVNLQKRMLDKHLFEFSRSDISQQNVISLFIKHKNKILEVFHTLHLSITYDDEKSWHEFHFPLERSDWNH